MFEAWLSDLLVPYLGHFLDVAPDKLRVSLFSGGCGGGGSGGGRKGECAPNIHMPHADGTGETGLATRAHTSFCRPEMHSNTIRLETGRAPNI